MSFIAFKSPPSRDKPLFSQPNSKAKMKQILLKEMPAKLYNRDEHFVELIEEYKEKHNLFVKSIAFDVVVEKKHHLTPRCVLGCHLVLHKYGSGSGSFFSGSSSEIAFDTEESIDEFKKKLFCTIRDFAKPYMYGIRSGDDVFERYSPKSVSGEAPKRFLVNKRWLSVVNEESGKPEVVFEKVTRSDERDDIIAHSVSLVARRGQKKKARFEHFGVGSEVGPAQKKKKGAEAKLPIPM